MEGVGKDLESASATYSKLEEDANDLQNTINDSLYEKQRNLDAITKHQRMLKRYQDLNEDKALGNAPLNVTEEDGPRLRQELQASEERLDTVKGVINNLRVDYGHLDEVLTRVLHLTED